MQSATNRLTRSLIPFTALVDLEQLKLALLLNGINPRIGGVLISGPKGTGKTTVVRAFADLLPEVEVVEGCRFGCSPKRTEQLCDECRARIAELGSLTIIRRKMRVVDLPLSTTEDRLIGSLDIERVLQDGVQALRPGILAEANQNVLYVDEVNLLPDHLVDDLLDAAATKVNIVEREGISVMHPSDFILVGTMNPEEGELRPQLLDRFALHVSVGEPLSIEQRMELVRRNIEFERDPVAFENRWSSHQEELRSRIIRAQEMLPRITMPESCLRAVAMACDALEVDGVRPDIIISKAAITNAAFEGREYVTVEDLRLAAILTLSHRTRRGGLLEPPSLNEIEQAITRAMDVVKKTVDKKQSPPEGQSDEHGTAGHRPASGGRFGRQNRVIDESMGSEKKKNSQ